MNIKAGSVIGTSSLRRAVQVSRKRPDVIVKPIRGNIETRIKKISGENYDAIVLAQAGISRLGVDVKYTHYLLMIFLHLLDRVQLLLLQEPMISNNLNAKKN